MQYHLVPTELRLRGGVWQRLPLLNLKSRREEFAEILHRSQPPNKPHSSMSYTQGR